jgi:oxygen-independent coproporphyrinogen-3 oxidase
VETAMTYSKRDNEFIAWYPCALEPASERDVFEKRGSVFYVHIPFCEAICDYCGFSVEILRDASVNTYLDALIWEIRHYREAGRFADRRFDCGAYGGGTPSVLTPAQFRRLAECVAAEIPLEPGSEVTIEANPLSLTLEKARAYKEAGVNRLSLGVQAFNDQALKTIGRPHRAKDIWRSLEIVNKTGFDNFSLDFMYGVPGESLEEFKVDLDLAIGTGAPHLSCFRLEIIPFTRLSLRRGAGLLPKALHSDEEIEQVLIHTLTSAGYRQYGAFNFAKLGFESVHNALVFNPPQADFFGFGNSSFSYVNDVSYCNYSEIGDYVAATKRREAPISYARRATAFEVMSRHFVLGLKMGGVSRAVFVEQVGLEPEIVFGPIIDNLIGDGLLAREHDSYVLTPLGRYYVNNVCKEFYVGPNIGRSQHSVSYIPKITAKDVEVVKRRAKNRVTLAL